MERDGFQPTCRIFISLISTMMTLGQPAPGLGPGTIIGSGCFNVLLITGVCYFAPPIGEWRRIQQFKIFVVSSVFCIWAYIWMMLILRYSTPGVIDVWEAIFTLIQQGILVRTVSCTGASVARSCSAGRIRQAAKPSSLGPVSPPVIALQTVIAYQIDTDWESVKNLVPASLLRLLGRRGRAAQYQLDSAQGRGRMISKPLGRKRQVLCLICICRDCFASAPPVCWRFPASDAISGIFSTRLALLRTQHDPGSRPQDRSCGTGARVSTGAFGL